MKESHALVYKFFEAVVEGDLPDSMLTNDMKGWGTLQGWMDKSAYQGMIRTLAQVSKQPLKFTIDSITAEEDRAVAEVHSEGILINDEEYRNTYVFVFRFRDGLFASVAEHYNALIVQEKFLPAMQLLKRQ